MVKVLTGVQPGQVSDAQAEVIAGAPTADLQERVPQPEGLDSLLEPVVEAPQAPASAPLETQEAPLEAPVTEQPSAEQLEAQERERVQPIGDRFRSDDVSVYKRRATKATDTPQADGGLIDRANNLADAVTNKVTGFGDLGPRGQGQLKTTLANAAAIDPQGNVDPQFSRMLSLITENTVAELALGEGTELVTTPEGERVEQQRQATLVQGQPAIIKAQANARLGKQIHQDWMRYQNQQAGRPTDEFQDITNEEAILLGDAAKELWYQANRGEKGQELMVRAKTDDGQVAFQLTKLGADKLAEGEAKRKKFFPKQHVRPAKAPTPSGQLEAEGKRYTKKISARTGTPASYKQINAAMRNLNGVPNVVDPQRMAILFSTLLPVLSGQLAIDPDAGDTTANVFAGAHNLGVAEYNKYVAADAETADGKYLDQQDKVAQSVFGIARERNGANYLTYYLQGFNGRIAPQQSHFDPTTSKAVRFVTRNAIPSKATPGSRINENLRQMYAMMLLPKRAKGDTALPAERERLLQIHTVQLAAEGKRLKEALQMTNEQAEAIAAAIEAGTPLTDPSFPQVSALALDPAADADLLKRIADKGEDGPAFIDGLIDFYEYTQNMAADRPHNSYFNAYMDGKTNGLASNGIQMGSESVAFKTGVMRSQGKTLLDGDIDIRDDLMIQLSEMVPEMAGHFGDNGGPMAQIAATVFNNRDLAKATTMTFGYGKELGSFKRDIQRTIEETAVGDTEFAEAMRLTGMDAASLSATLLPTYISGLEQALDPTALASRNVMRGAAIQFAVANELMTIDGPTDMPLYIGGTETTGYQEGEAYRIWDQDTGKYRTATAAYYGDEATSAATKIRTDDEGNKSEEVGGIAYGGAVPAPVQAIDAATVALTASGHSWKRLAENSHGSPYLHTIYDAFKVDAMGYDVVLDEVNKNWLNASMDWSYLDATRDAVKELNKTFNQKMAQKDAKAQVEPNEWKMMAYLLEPGKIKEDGQWKTVPKALINKLEKLVADDVDATETARKIVSRLRAKGYGWSSGATPTYAQLQEFFNALQEETKLVHRLSKMAHVVGEKKKKLKSKIKASGKEVFQYYSH